MGIGETPATLIRCTDIQKVYALDEKRGTRLRVLNGIGLSITGGEIISIIGASGSGKSTLLQILGGLDRPTSGEVYWQESNIFSISDDALARLRNSTVGFVFQFHHLLPEFTALENVAIPMMIHGEVFASAAPRAAELLGKVGLRERLDHKPGELSGGEQQRVAVARALANAPQVIFADEPTGNLDSSGSEQLHELIRELNKTERQTFVIVTHNDRFAEQAHRTFRMADGVLTQL